LSKDCDVINKVLTTIKKHNLIKENDKIVVGVSGGPDSVCLLHILNNLKEEMKFDIVVAHINHMIREEADEETEYVENMCKTMGVKCFVKRINVTQKASCEKMGTEEAGRNARYEFFEEVCKLTNSNKIATAHNANDNAETVLMNIFRGTSVSGLKGIEPIRDGKIIRPLIECERVDIENYCSSNHLEPRIDMSNFENVYTRNKVRNIVIPNLKEEFNPNIIGAINKLSNLATQEEEFVQRYTNNVIDEKLLVNVDEEIRNDLKLDGVQNCFVMNVKEFNKLDEFLKSKVVVNIIQKVAGSIQGIEKVNVEEIIGLCSKNIGNKYLTPTKRLRVFINRGKVAFVAVP